MVRLSFLSAHPARLPRHLASTNRVIEQNLGSILARVFLSPGLYVSIPLDSPRISGSSKPIRGPHLFKISSPVLCTFFEYTLLALSEQPISHAAVLVELCGRLLCPTVRAFLCFHGASIPQVQIPFELFDGKFFKRILLGKSVVWKDQIFLLFLFGRPILCPFALIQKPNKV